MTIEDIIKNYKVIGRNQTKTGEDRCFFLNETDNILYCFGPSNYIRQAFDKKDREKIVIIEFENGPYLEIGDNVYAEKVIIKFELFTDHGIPIAALHLGNKIEPKKKKRKKGNTGVV
jgi:hypothetical protein